MRTYFLEDPVHPDGGITVGCKDDHDPWSRPCKYFVEGEKEA